MTTRRNVLRGAGPSPAAPRPTSLVEILRRRAAEDGERPAFVFLRDGEHEEARLTFAELDRRARSVAAGLQAAGLAEQRVLLLFPPGLDFVSAFLGCLYARAVAVPAYPPRAGRPEPRLRAILADARPALALGSAEVVRRWQALADEDEVYASVAAEPAAGWDDAERWRPCRPAAADLAFLQYTSGSTAAPKGVMVGHGNLVHNEELIRSACGHDRDSTFVSWLPVYHDMGLIGSVLQPLYVGSLCVLMSPVAFLQRPVRWLRAIGRYRARTSGAPNFAYELCLRKVPAEERRGLDLSSWRVAFNGAEPVRASTLDAFTRGFAESGFRPDAFFPCFGLAEATLMVTGPPRREPPSIGWFTGLAAHRAAPAEPTAAEARPLVGCGPALLDQEVAVVDPESREELPDGRIGELWVSGPSVALGYWGRPELSAETFRARLGATLRPRLAGRDFLRTGDLGFLHRGELFVTGRRKDLIIVRGRNLYPQDVEEVVEASHPALRAGASAAFAIDGVEGEAVAVVQEIDPRRRGEADEMVAAIRTAVAERLEAPVAAVALVRPRSVPKTTSGKVQRALCRRLFLEGGLEPLAEWRAEEAAAAAPAEEAPEDELGIVRRLVRDVLGPAAGGLGAGEPLARAGLDSLSAVELGHRLESELGLALPLHEVLFDLSLGGLADRLRRRPPVGAAEASAADGCEEIGEHSLSPGQEGLWFLHELDPASPAYNVAGGGRLGGAVDAAALEAALVRLVARHPALRARFVRGRDGQPVQRVRSAAAVDFLALEVTGDGRAELDRELFRPFDLARDPVLRVRLLRPSDGDPVLLVVAHHLAVDLWSFGILLSELRALLGTGGGEAPVPAASFFALARRQRRELNEQEVERRWRHWRSRLPGVVEPELPADRPRPARGRHRAGVHAFAIDPATAERVEALARRSGTTVAVALLAAYCALIHRLCDAGRVQVAVPDSGRDRAAVAGVVGYLVSLVPLVSRVEDDPSFAGHLERVRAELRAALEHVLPVHTLIERVRAGSPDGGAPGLQVAFSSQRTPRDEPGALARFAAGEGGARLDLAGVPFTSLAFEEMPAPYELSLFVLAAEGRWRGVLHFDLDRFDRSTAARLAGWFGVLLGGAAAAPATALSRLPLITPAERTQLLDGWQGRGRRPQPRAPLLERVARHAAARPSAPAVVQGERVVTYGELTTAARRLARRLQDAGAGPEQRVGILAGRTPEAVAALLAVLESGAAYVPIDPAFPDARVELLLRESAAAVLLTDDPGRGEAVAGGRRVVPLAGTAAAGGGDPPATRVPRHPESLAYVVFTSGSTGQPKGVEISHGALLDLVDWHLEAFALTAGDAGSHLASAAFDAAVWEIWPPLAAGARLHLPPDEETRVVPERLRDWLVESAVTAAFAPTAVAEALVELPWPEPALRVLLTGGDRLLARPRAGLPFRLDNNYGPTEGTVVATSGPVQSEGAGRPDIGRALPHARLYVADRRGRLLPPGAHGELLLGGSALARGYSGQPALTADRFRPDPWSGVPGARLYRTGDRVRWLADGRLDFLGRADEQVQVRGVRVEPGEIEHLLARLPGVREAVVAAVPGNGRDERLAAFVAAPGATVEALRAGLAEELPAVMVPTSWALLDRLPRNPHGKIDRQALLAALERTAAPAAAAHEPPTGAVEEELAALWAEVLGRPSVGVGEDFFALGGHSLLAGRLVNRIGSRFGVELPLRSLFDHPTVRQLAGVLAAMRPAAEEPIPRLPRGAELPLSSAQRRLWFLDRLEEGAPTYHVPLCADLEGDLDRAALAAAVACLGRRHEALRTAFPERRGEPVQAIGGGAPALSLVDLGSLPEGRRPPAVERATRRLARRPFDLARGPLLRAALIVTGARRHRLVFVLHHLIVDGWSVRVLLDDLAAFYRAALGAAAAPRELALQPADVAAWEGRAIDEGRHEPALAEWARRLAAVPVLAMPTDRPRPARRGARGGTVRRRLAGELGDRLESLSAATGATPFMLLGAAFTALLHLHSGQRDLALGTPVARRDRSELEPLVGLLLNTVVLRLEVDPHAGYSHLVDRVRGATLDAQARAEVPFEMVVERLQPERDLAHGPLFQVLFSVEDELPALELPGLTARLHEIDTGTAKFDLSLFVRREARGWQAAIEYSRDLYEGTTAQRLLDRLAVLLAAALEGPARPLAALPRMTPAEERQCLREWQGAERPVAVAALHELVAAQAARAPEREAIVWRDEAVCYGELRRRSTRLARRLRAAGVGAESVVGVAMRRTPRLVEALLAVLEAGGAYLPLDLAYPAERLRWMVADAGAAVVLVDAASAAAARRRLGAEAPPLLDVEAAAAAGEEGEPDLPAVDPAQAAYLIYTSGSTGRPKGVVISHRSAVALVEWARRVFAEEELSAVVAATSISFDLSVFELFAPLAAGGAVHLVDDALAVADIAEPRRVRLLNTVPSAAAELLRLGALPEGPLTVNLAGEPLPASLARDLLARPGVRRLLNLYGPSEDTTYSTWDEVPRAADGEPTIGRPVDDTRAVLLDRELRPVPPGVPGELFLSGAGLARGYLDRPALTAERFLPDPFSPQGGARMYRTGDLARHLADGRLAFLGRLDHQVKVRGFRIELGEVESALRAHPALSDAAVVVGRMGEEPALVAFVVARQGAAADDVRRFLAQRLPPPMVPSTIEVLEELPLTPNGKIDRQALARRGTTAAPPPGLPPAAGRGPSAAEELVAMVWREVLELERVELDRTFFELGGHSLHATRVLARLREVFAVELPVRTVFEEPTVRGLARRLEEARASSPPAPRRPLTRAAGAGDRPLSHAQLRLWFLDRWQPGTALYNLPGALHLGGRLDVAALAGALAAVVRRHEALRTRFVVVAGRPAQRVAPPAPPSLPVIDLGGLPPAAARRESARLAREEARRPFDLADAPLLRVRLLALGDDRHTLLVNLHHIVADGWSLGVLTRELAVLYPAGGRAAGLPELPELPVQYPDFAAWQHATPPEAEERLLAFWRDQLAGCTPLELPTDRPRPARPTFAGGEVGLRVEPRLAARLDEVGLRRGATRFMVLLAAWQAVLGRIAGHHAPVVGTPVAGRGRREVEGLIGMFVNTLPLRGDLTGEPSFAALLERVRERVLDALAHQELPFEKMVEALAPERRGDNPLFQTLLAVEGEPPVALELPGLTIAFEELPTGLERLDLTLRFVAAGGGLGGTLSFRRDLFDRSTARRLTRHLLTFLAAAAEDPERPISALPLLDAVQRHQVLWEWGQAVPASGGLLHRRFERVARERPEAVAVVCREQVWSYGELDRRAEALAGRLQALGAAPEVPVAVCLERSPWLLVAVLAVLKAGAAYVPLDPAYPPARLAFMLRDAAAPLVVGDERLLAELGVAGSLGDGAVVVAPDAPTAAAPPAVAPRLDPANLAYVLYTSGSTGRPKGVAVTHRSAAALVEWALDAFPAAALDAVVASTSLCFDLSVFEVFVPLSCGGRVVLVQDALELAANGAAARATLLNTVPSAAAELVRGGRLPAGLEVVALAGEPLPRTLVDRLHAAGARRVLNLYGPSEDTTYSTFAEVPPGDRRAPAIGRPVAGTVARILDGVGRPVPPGVAGELYLGGAGLARGYLGRPALTAERFVPDPFGRQPGARLYRTGDRCRHRADGEIEFLGRLDRQVKVRGFRIELGEVEAVLAGHPALREAAVAVEADGGAASRLVGFVVAAGEELEPAVLREHLAARLPGYMVPSLFVPLDELPRLPNGKVDRGRLPAVAAALRREAPHRPPGNALEARLADLWRELLTVERVGVDDDFFELGGHSLLAAQVLFRVEEEEGVAVPLPALFAAPTVASLARLIEDGRAAGMAADAGIARVARDRHRRRVVVEGAA